MVTFAKTYSDSELIVLLKKKDPGACNFLYEKHAGALYSLIDQIVPSTKTVNEILAEVFITIIDSIGQYDPSRSRLFTWMMQLTRQTALEKLKAMPEQEHAEHLLVQIDRRGVKGLISKLQKDDQQLISLTYLKGYSVDELAGHLDIPAATVKTSINKALVSINPRAAK